MPGCSGHLHQSLACLDSGKNLFYDENDANNMSDLFKHYVAGQVCIL